MERAGVQLAADDAAKYFATLDKVNKATLALISGAQSAVDALNDLEQEENQAGKAARGLGNNTEDTTKKLSFLERATVGAAEKVGHLATQALYDAGRAVLQFGVDGVRAAGDFEGGMNRFASITGDALDQSGQSLDDFKDLFISLGRDLPVSTAEVQEAAINMAKGGIEPATIAAGGLKTVLDLAAAGELGIAEAAEISAKQLGVWVDSAASADEKAQFLTQSANLLAQAANASTVDVDELALGLANVGSIGKTAGLTFQETVQTMALLAPGFSSAADAGTSFKTFLTSLQPRTDKQADAMARLGLLTKDGTSAFYDAQGSFIGMDKAADLLHGSLKGLSQAEKVAALQAIFGQDAFRAAALIAEKGADGFRQMGIDMAGAGSASEQAAKKQQGFNVAVDNLMGSLEAFQITVFSRALPALTALVNLIAGGINAVTDYAEATAQGETALSSIISFVETAALPTIYGLTAALAAYATVQTIQAIPAILASLPAIAAQTAAFVANAVAVAATVAPYALIAAAVAGVVLAYQGLQNQVASVTDKVLASSPAWQASVQALEAYDAASKETRAATQGQADTLRALQTEQRGAIEQYALHTAAYEQFGAASGQTAESLDKERLAINARGDSIIAATGALNDQMQAEISVQAASMTATAQAADLRDGTNELGNQAKLTADDIQKLGEKIQDVYQKGQEAVQGYATNQATFLASVEQRQQEHAAKIQSLEAEKNKATTDDQKQAIDTQIAQANQAYHDQETAAAESYARQQAAQQQHLGQMLIDYTVSQAQLGNISKDRAAEITAALEQAYGLQESSVASTFLKMAGSIDTFSKDSTGDVNTLISTLHDQQQQAADTQKAMDDYATTYTAEAVSNFVDAKGDADDYIQSLENIPTRVQSEMALPGIKDREQEIRDINRGLQQLPKEVRIHVSVKDDVPPEYKPGSPTPFEIGIRGITSAIDELAQSGVFLPGLTQNAADFAAELDKLITKSDLPDDAENLGEEIIAGWGDGMDRAFGDLRSQVEDMSGELQQTLGEAWDVHSPSGVTEDLGENIMLGLLTSIDGMLPDLLNVVQQITATMGEGMSGLTDEMRKQLEDQLAAIADTVGGLPDLINSALADAYTSTADFLRQQSDNLQGIFDIGRDPGDAARLQDQVSTLDKQIAEKQQQLVDIREGRVIVSDEDELKLERELSALAVQRLDLSNQQAAAAQKQQQRLELQQRTQEAITQATNEASAMDDPTKAAAFLKLRSQQIMRMADLEQQRLEATDPAQQALLDAQIALEQRSQEAELQAFALQQDQLGATQDLIDALNTLNNNLSIEGDMPPEILALYNLLVQLTQAAGMASGGTMQATQPYLVGERGPELVVPHQASDIYNALDTRRALAPQTASAGGTANYYGPSYTIAVDARGSNLTESQIERAVQRGMGAEGRDADVRIRTGVQ